MKQCSFLFLALLWFYLIKQIKSTSFTEIFEIFLTDINDNTPEFNVDSENFQIIEEASNVLVGTVRIMMKRYVLI